MMKTYTGLDATTLVRSGYELTGLRREIETHCHHQLLSTVRVNNTIVGCKAFVI